METTRVPGQPAHNAAAIARQKPGQPPAGDDSAAAGGFLALLAAMGGDEGAITVAGNEGLLSQSDGTTPQDSAPTSAEIAQGLLQAGLLAQQGLPAQSAGVQGSVPLAGQAGSGALPAAVNLLGAEGGNLSGVLAQVLADGLVAQTTRMDAAVAGGAVLSAEGGGVAAAKSSAGLWGKGAAGVGAALSLQDRALTGKAGATKLAVAGGGDGVVAPSASAVAPAVLQAQGALLGGAGGPREAGPLPVEALDPSVAGGAAVAAPHSTRSQEQGQSLGQQQGGAAPGTELGSTEAAQLPGAEASYEAAMVAAEEALTEQVTYWVNQNLQKAQLTVEHEGGLVDVSVALQGNEAHVSLMADQAQARDVLDADQSQLRELLRQQGLELAGLTVGLSAGRQGGQQERSSGQAGQPSGTAARAGEAGTTARVGVRVLTDRAVDLFV